MQLWQHQDLLMLICGVFFLYMYSILHAKNVKVLAMCRFFFSKMLFIKCVVYTHILCVLCTCVFSCQEGCQ